MQNKYVGDVGDFGKHGLLRFLSGVTSEDEESRLRLGVIWYMHHDERHGNDANKVSADGNHTEYLTRTPKYDRAIFRDCDPDLWETLRDLVFREARCVHCVEGAGILPDDTRYFNALLYYPPHMRNPAREEMRESWLTAAHRKVKGTDLVFVDPDNGPREGGMFAADGTKHVYMKDLQGLWGRKQNLVIYHQMGRRDITPEQTKEYAAKLRYKLDGAYPISLLFRRGQARAFYVVPHPEHEHAGIIRERVGRFLYKWGAHFEEVR